MKKTLKCYFEHKHNGSQHTLHKRRPCRNFSDQKSELLIDKGFLLYLKMCHMSVRSQ